MSAKKYRVRLTAEERRELKALVSRGRAAAYKQTHTRILLLSDEGVEAALRRKQQLNRRPKKLDGLGVAHLIALSCGEPPEGRSGWTLKLLADRLVECEIVESISTETVRQT